MKRTAVAVITSILVASGISGPAYATSPTLGDGAAGAAVNASVNVAVDMASPRPGQFCKRADRGRVVNSAYGQLKCKADPNNDSFSRWYRL